MNKKITKISLHSALSVHLECNHFFFNICYFPPPKSENCKITAFRKENNIIRIGGDRGGGRPNHPHTSEVIDLQSLGKSVS